MKNQKTTRVRLTALAVAGLALAGVASTPAHAADPRPVMPLNGWNGKLGPGLGSVKTPFGVVEAARPLSSRSDDAIYFHTSTGQPVQQVPITHMGPGLHMGPGPWSIKSPFSGLYTNGTF